MQKLRYMYNSFLKIIDGQHNNCPSCGSSSYEHFDDPRFSKFPTSLRLCRECFLSYRHPVTLSVESEKYYDEEYQQRGLTTDLPNSAFLSELIKNNFHGSEKDFSHWIPVMRRLSDELDRPLRVLDYGANWGYTVFQLQKCDFVEHVVGYEYSRVRSQFGADKLGVKYVQEDQFDGSYDLVFSAHVIEHMYNPSIFKAHVDQILVEQGFVLLTCPNGSLSGIINNGVQWRRRWGEAHPNMISDIFLERHPI